MHEQYREKNRQLERTVLIAKDSKADGKRENGYSRIEVRGKGEEVIERWRS